MLVTKQEIQNARELLEQKRQRVKRNKPFKQNAKQDAIDRLMENARQAVSLPPVPQEVRPTLSLDEIKEKNGIVSLSSLSTDHMTPEQKKDFLAVLETIKNWRKDVENRPGLSFVLCSRQYGIGKTHIAKAVMGSFAEVLIPLDDESPPVVVRHGLMLTSRMCMSLLDGEDWNSGLIRAKRAGEVDFRESIRIVVLDDVGREGKIKYIKQEAQESERQARYYEIINWCYENSISVFITSNMQINELGSYFNEATWDRLNEMAPRGCMTVLEGIPSYRMFTSGRL